MNEPTLSTEQKGLLEKEIETLNTQLSLINILLYKEHSGQRVTLTPSAILATEITTTTGTEG